jgi:hypothetical protein
MRAQEIRSIVAENPHQAVTLHLTSGRSVLIQGLDYVFFPPSAQTIVVAVPEGGFAIIDCATVSEIRPQPRSKKIAHA